jgi:Cu+-exporting ATPase
MDTTSETVLDAVCGMRLDRANARRLAWAGATYYFCSESCERKFEARQGQ